MLNIDSVPYIVSLSTAVVTHFPGYEGSLCDKSCTNSTDHELFVGNAVNQLANEYSGFYGARTFITLFTRAHHWSLS
jgi:hypothetical protein